MASSILENELSLPHLEVRAARIGIYHARQADYETKTWKNRNDSRLEISKISRLETEEPKIRAEQEYDLEAI